jgi:hypothetical protein
MLPLLLILFVLKLLYLPSFSLNLGQLDDFPMRTLGDGAYSTSRGDRLIVRSQEIKSEEAARELVADSAAAIDGLYRKRVNPYQGKISAEIECSLKEALPVMKREEGSFGIKLTYQLMANELYVYGVCDPKDFAYRSFLVILYCREEQELFRIRYFADKNAEPGELASLAGEVSCRRYY